MLQSGPSSSCIYAVFSGAVNCDITPGSFVFVRMKSSVLMNHAVTVSSLSGVGSFSPKGVAVATNGNIYFTANNAVYEIAAGTGFPTSLTCLT